MAKNPKTVTSVSTGKTEADKALETIDDYLQEHEGWTKGIAWHLHCFCRRGKGEDYGYHSSNLEYASWFIEQLIKTFMNPEAAKVFLQTNDETPEHLSENLLALKTLFDDFSKDPTVSARMDRIEAGYFNRLENRTDSDMQNLQVIYARAKDLAYAKERIINYYRGQFKKAG